MQTSELPAADAATGDAAPELQHLRLRLSEPWQHRGPGAEVVGWVRPRQAGGHPELAGRAVLGVNCGPFSLALDPTPAELRALAHLCTSLADQMDCAAARDRVARQLAGDGVA